MKNILFFLILVLCSLSFLSCGKYAPPIPPERLAPKAVYDIQVIPYTSGVAFRWKGNTKDLRSKELKTMNGYYIERGCIDVDDQGSYDTEKDIAEIDFTILSIVNDNQIKIREKLKKDALAKGLSARRVKVPTDKLSFNYVDETIKNGQTCFYKITPFNQEDVKGAESKPIRVRFYGETSSVVILGGKKSQSNAVRYDN